MTSANPLENLSALIRCPSVTPDEGGALTALQAQLEPLGFAVDRVFFSEDGTPDIENLYARLGSDGPHLMFAGHTDVVPPGDSDKWLHPPYSAHVLDGKIHGRGAVDMKGGIACFTAAVARFIKKHGQPRGQISFLITGDEEGPAINGTAKLLEWARKRGEHWDAALVGEPTNPETLGDMIKIGRRGSVSARVTIHGVQGHAAYPHLADNAVPGALMLADSLLYPQLDRGTERFQPSNLEITSMDVGNPATNVVPGRATFDFNIRFNDKWSPEAIMAEVHNRLDRAARRTKLRSRNKQPVEFTVDWRDRPSPVFSTHDDRLIGTLAGSVEKITGRKPELSTSGGTSDARFIKDYCPVVEFGLVGKTMHMANEYAAIDDLETLTQIYQQFISDWFA